MTAVSSRRRLGVALVLDPPVAVEVNGLRRALGDVGLQKVPPHITLVSPLNVRVGDLPAALAVLRAAAAAMRGPLTLTLGPPASFRPLSPVVYLEVGGDLPALRTLHASLQAPPLLRRNTWPWVPHVTLIDGANDERIAAALAALDRYAAVCLVDRVVLLEERSRAGQGGSGLGAGPGGTLGWRPLADAAFGPEVVVGRGGLALHLTLGRLLDPEGMALLTASGVDAASTRPALADIVATARREGTVVALGAAWRKPDGGHVGVFVAPAVRRQGIGSVVLAQVETAVRRAGWGYPSLAAAGPAGFYRSRSDYSKATDE